MSDTHIVIQDPDGKLNMALMEARAFPVEILGKPVEISIAGASVMGYLLRYETYSLSGGGEFEFVIPQKVKDHSPAKKRKGKA